MQCTGGFLQICWYAYKLKAEQTSSNMESRRMRWVGHVARMVEKMNVYRLLVGKPEGKTKEDQDVGGWIILGWILERWDGVMWTGLDWLWIGTGGELL
jgi:hypothetical protein